MVRMELPGKRKRERHNMSYMDAVREDMAVTGVTAEDARRRNQMVMTNPM